MLSSSEYFVWARAIHIMAVVIWIGGVAFVTLVLLPSLKNLPKQEQRLHIFEQLEGKFSFYAKVVTLLTGISGIYMLEFLQAWSRYLSADFWWMHLMTLVWLVLSLILFVFEPWFLHQYFRQQAEKNHQRAFFWAQRMHQVLLFISTVAIMGAVLGAHGGI